LPTGCFALEWAFLREQLEAHPDATRAQTAPVEKKSGTFYSLLRIHWQNYNHWLHDCLMRLYAVQDLLPPDTQFIVPADLKPNWQSALQALGIPKSRQVAFDGQTTWLLETLYFTSHTRRASFDLPAEVNWFRTQMWQGCGIGDGFRPQTARHPFSRAPRRTRHYRSRRGAEWRKIVNDAEVARFLRRYSFESHVLEDLSFCKQVELFANAEFVIACHGAGNTNMLFAPPQATLVEIFSPRYVRNDFWAMCDAAQVNYWYMLGQAVPAEHTPLADDIHVPLEKLKQLVTAVLARPHS
jgi:capsular polysaccharide biosynthesis protein